MYSSRDVGVDVSQSLSPLETIPPGVPVPPHVNQPYRHHSASWPANVSNSATIQPNDSTASAHQRSKPWRFPGLRSFANIARKIPLFRRSPRQACENHVTSSARPSRKEHRPADSPSSPILGTTSHDRGGQASAGADHAQNVVHPLSSSKSYNIFSLGRYRRKQQQTVARPNPSHPPTIPPPPPGLFSRRALQEAGSDTPLRAKSKELGEQNQALLHRAHSPHKQGVIKPCPQQDDRTPSDQPSVETSTYPPASLSYPGVSASPSSFRPAQPLRRTYTYAPRGLLPEKPKALRVAAPSKLTRFPNEVEGRVPHSEHDPENPSVTPSDQAHTIPPREPKEGPSSSGNDLQAVTYATAGASATFGVCHEPPAISRHKRLRNVQRTSSKKCKTLVPSYNVSDLDEDEIMNQSEEDNCEVYFDAHSDSDNGPRSSKSISKRSFSTASMIGTGSSEDGLG